VGRSVIQPNEASVPLTLSEPVYRVTVRPAGPAGARLRPGDAAAGRHGARCRHLVDQRRVIEWVFDPILSITGRV
jgi:membrane fusion protein